MISEAAFAAKYRDDVKGMVLLDAAFPGELPLERYWPKDERLTHGMWKESAEKVDELSVYQLASRLKQPKIPVTYLLATPSTWTVGSPKYNAVIHDRIAAYVKGFKPRHPQEGAEPALHGGIGVAADRRGARPPHRRALRRSGPGVGSVDI